MNERRRLLIAAGVGLLAPCPANSQAPSGPARGRTLGVLWGDGPEDSVATPAFAAFKVGLAVRGYHEGHNLTLESRFADGRYDRLPALAASLVQKKVDLVVAVGTPITRAAHAATTRIPIVAVNVTLPVKHGFATSLARPGGNVTGITNSSIDTGIKRLQILARLAPNARRIGFIVNPDNRAHVDSPVEERAAALRLEATRIQVRDASDALRELEAHRSRVDAVTIGQDYAFTRLLPLFAKLALSHAWASNAQQRAFVELGGLSSYGQDPNEQWRIAAEYAARILGGANPGELPFVEASQFEFVLNRRTADMLRLAIPQDMLLDAQVIQP